MMTPFLWKQSVALGTDSEAKLFQYARVRLTGVMVSILAVILIGFSFALYQALSLNLQGTLEGDFADSAAQQHVISETLAATLRDIAFGDLLILILAAGIAYWLAGRILRPVQQSVRAQKAFAANASHELRTPIAVVRNELEVLARDKNRTQASTDVVLQDALEEMTRLSTMVGDLLALARSEANPSLIKEEIDLSTVVTAAVTTLKKVAATAGVTLAVTGGLTQKVRGDVAAIERAVVNVVRNAIEHTPAGGSITVVLSDGQGFVQIEVVDTGSGIPAADLPHVFDRFYKGSRSNGSGLGLALVKEIMTQHGGTVTISSSEGQGTVVTLQWSIG